MVVGISAFYGGPDYYSKQITSINNGRPFLGIFDQQHVVAVDGGNWHIDDNSGLYVWEEVLFHDPQSSHPDSTMAAGDWLTFNAGGLNREDEGSCDLLSYCSLSWSLLPSG